MDPLSTIGAIAAWAVAGKKQVDDLKDHLDEAISDPDDSPADYAPDTKNCDGYWACEEQGKRKQKKQRGW